MDKRQDNGGSRSGAGRKKIKEKLSQYDKAISLLDTLVVPALNVLKETLKSGSKYNRILASKIILKKAIADLKDIDLTIESNKTEVIFRDETKDGIK